MDSRPSDESWLELLERGRVERIRAAARIRAEHKRIVEAMKEQSEREAAHKPSVAVQVGLGALAVLTLTFGLPFAAGAIATALTEGLSKEENDSHGQAATRAVRRGATRAKPVPQRILPPGYFNELDELRRSMDMDCGRFYNIGVVGMTKVGKSTFVNALRGLRNKQPGAAEAGITQCTRDIKPYDHPRFPDHIKIWDLPGCGTTDFPIATYVKDCKLRAFPCLIIAYKDTVPEWMPKALSMCDSLDVAAIVVRTQVDLDVERAMNDMGMTEAQAIEHVRKVTYEETSEYEGVPVLLASAWDMQQGKPLRFDESLLDVFLLRCAAGKVGLQWGSRSRPGRRRPGSQGKPT